MNIENTISIWKEQERNIRMRLAKPDSINPSRFENLTGMDIFNAIFSGDLPTPPMGETLDYIPIHIEYGHAIFQGRPQHKHYNPMGTIHGGWFCTLLDSAVGCAIHSTLAAGKGYTTLELKVNIVRALTDRVPLVRAEGKVIHVGRQTATAEGKILGPDGTLYAHATTTCLILNSKL